MNLEHLHPSIRDVAMMGVEERVHWTNKPRWIGYSRAKVILGKMNDLLAHPIVPRMPNMLLIGESNNGKTNIAQKFAQNHPADENFGGEHMIAKVLYINAPPGPNDGSLYSEILGAMFKRIPNSNTDAKRDAVIDALRAIQLKVLVIDDLHNLLAGATVKQQYFLNVIKYLGNAAKISIIGCGTGDLLRAVSIDPQIRNRFVPDFLPKWQLNKESLKLFKSLEQTVPLREPSNLYSDLMAKKILAMSEGTIGEMSLLVNAAAIHAMRNGHERITTDSINECGYVPPSDRTQQAALA